MEKKVEIRWVWGKFSCGNPGESDFDQGNINCILVFYLPPDLYKKYCYKKKCTSAFAPTLALNADTVKEKEMIFS